MGKASTEGPQGRGLPVQRPAGALLSASVDTLCPGQSPSENVTGLLENVMGILALPEVGRR